MKRTLYGVGGTFAIIALFCVWFAIASNYDYDALAGTYNFKNSDCSSTLVLKADRTFSQQLTEDGKTNSASGTWRRIGEGGVNFSLGFLRIPGAKQYREEFPDHLEGTVEDDEYYGHFEKILTLYPMLKLNANPPGPTLYKRLFH
jgi:hypothetical protein